MIKSRFDTKKLEELYNKGYSDKKVSLSLGVSKAHARRLRKNLNIDQSKVAVIENLEAEVWKPLLECPLLYAISSKGRVKSLAKELLKTDGITKQLWKEKLLSQQLDKDGYCKVKLTISANKTLFYRVHRLVAKVFLENPEGKKCVNHKDGNKLNNNLYNLEWCTIAENNEHALKIGIYKGIKGELNPCAKLKLTDIKEIRMSKELSTKELSVKYNVYISTIKSIIKGKTWKNV